MMKEKVVKAIQRILYGRIRKENIPLYWEILRIIEMNEPIRIEYFNNIRPLYRSFDRRLRVLEELGLIKINDNWEYEITEEGVEFLTELPKHMILKVNFPRIRYASRLINTNKGKSKIVKCDLCGRYDPNYIEIAGYHVCHYCLREIFRKKLGWTWEEGE